MAFCYILLGHLIGDFVLQTNRIAVNKPKHKRWNILHAVIVTLCMLIFAVPFGFVILLLTFLAGVLHLLIDRAKPVVIEKYRIPELPAFIADQALHIAIIAFVSSFASREPYLLFLDGDYIVIFLVFTAVTYFAAIFNQYLLTGLFPRADNTFFRNGEKLAGICIRFLITLSIFLALRFNFLFLFMLLVVPVILILQARFNRKRPCSMRELLVKLLLDGVFSAAGACVLLYFN